MAGKRSASEGPRGFWSKMLSASKVKRILEKRGFDPDAFMRDYQNDKTRGSRASRRPTPRESDAVAQYHRDWDIQALMTRLEVRTKASALAVVDRVMRWQARSGETQVVRKARPTRGRHASF